MLEDVQAGRAGGSRDIWRVGDAVDGGSKNGGLENALMGWIGRGNGRGRVDLDVVGGEG